MNRIAVGLCALSLLTFSSRADARPARTTQVPHGGSLSCGVCHLAPGGGGARTVFGEDANGSLNVAGQAGVVDWSALAALDSDGDGVDNGTELNDPNGDWTAGEADPGVFADTSDVNAAPGGDGDGDTGDGDGDGNDGGPGPVDGGGDGDGDGGCACGAGQSSMAIFGIGLVALWRRRRLLP